MRKKTIMSAFAIAIVAMTAFAGYKTMSHQSTAADLMLDENVEALTEGETVGSYVRSTSVCPSRCSYKKSVSCKSGGREECYPSDCC